MFSTLGALLSFFLSKYGTFACLGWRYFVNVAHFLCYALVHSGRDGIEMFMSRRRVFVE